MLVNTWLILNYTSVDLGFAFHALSSLHMYLAHAEHPYQSLLVQSD